VFIQMCEQLKRCSTVKCVKCFSPISKIYIIVKIKKEFMTVLYNNKLYLNMYIPFLRILKSKAFVYANKNA